MPFDIDVPVNVVLTLGVHNDPLLFNRLIYAERIDI